jgi:uncharacterized protein (DUF433 family)
MTPVVLIVWQDRSFRGIKVAVHRREKNMKLKSLDVPLRIEDGAIKVADSRILLDVIVEEFENGSSPERIAQDYDTLKLADIFGAITYYLQHKAEVTEYIRQQEQEGEELRRESEARHPDRADLRAKLLARRAQLEQNHAAPAQ